MSAPVAGAAAVAAVAGPVHVVGTGLLGTSVALLLRGHGVEVTLEDPSPAALAVAQQVGGGRPRVAGEGDPVLVVVAAPPDVTAQVVARQLERFPAAVVTDVASVKAVVLEELTAAGADLTRYVGSHPMAGREKGGPAHASADLFVGRPWVIAAPPAAAPPAVLKVRELAVDAGAFLVYMDAARHDAAVALVSHVPQVLSSLTAARLAEADPAALDLAGQGLRDVTRIAKSDPALWSSILVGNGAAVAAVLKQVRSDLDRAIAALDLGPAEQTLGQAVLELTGLLGAGNRGVERVPGKHGGAQRVFDQVTVMVPDEPGELGRLFGEMGQLGINLEDLQLEHGAGQAVGLATLAVQPGLGPELVAGLEAQGWRILK
ncbi:MAG: prephenate dehydrogenase [Bifidobacteriaceae bacterium]|nr:prephenate dehydrogenase [Bifidobacteriaceae bacterium]